MSIASESNRNNYIGNGAALTYSYTFKIFNDDELRVTVKSNLDIETTLTLNTHYTVTGVGSNSGGAISLVNGAFDWINATFLKSGYALTIRRDLKLIQETDIRNQGEFFPEIHEDVFDRLTMLDQQQQDELSRSVKLSETSVVADFDPTLPASIVGEVSKVLITNATGDGWDVGPSASAISSAAADAAAAAASAAAALASETNAAASEANAASAAASAVSVHEADTTSVHGIANTSLLLTTTGTQVVTNKDIDGGTASNTSRITVPKASKATLDALTRKEATVVYASDTDKLYYDDGSILKLVGSGSGGETNFVTDGDAEGASIISTYNDSSTTRPVDGTSGTATNLATSISSTSPLIGTNSFLLSKTGSASTQGKGWSVPFTIDSAYKAKVLQIEFDYIVNSGTFVAGSSSAESDVIVYIYDVTNSQLIEPSSIKLLSNSTTISDKFVANFQTSATGTSYRLIFHCQSTSASNYELKVDNITVKPSRYVFGTPITDWVAYTPTAGATNITALGQWRRVGDTLEARVQLTATGTPVGNITASIPSGLTIDTTKLPAGSAPQKLGFGYIEDNAILGLDGFVYYNNTTTVGFAVGNASGTYNSSWWVSTSSPFSWDSTDFLRMQFSVPILGWSSSVQQSDSYSARNVILNTNRPTGLIGTSAGTWATLTFTGATDLTGSWNGTDTWTCPTSDWYRIKVMASQYTNAAAYFDVGYRISGGSDVILNRGFGSATASAVVNGTDTVYLTAGQTIQARVATEGTQGANLRQLTIERVQAPTTISATERISFSTTSSTTAATTSAPFIYPTVVENSHGAYSSTTGKFTAPVSGKYFFSASAYNGAAFTILIYKNGASVKQGQQGTATSVSTVTHTVYLLAGDTIEARPDGAVTANGSAILNTFDGFLIK